MIIITDNPDFSKNYYLYNELNNSGTPLTSELEKAFLDDKNVFSYQINQDFWKYSIITEFSENSQFDTLINLSNSKINIPDKTFCLAGYGKKFHGFRNRHWESKPGNIHLSCYFKPYINVSEIGLGFTILAANSVIDTLDRLVGFKNLASIKWVNDIVVNDSKICGVIAQTQIQGNKITDAFIGIGLNVEVSPDITPTSFVPNSTCINDISSLKYSHEYITHLLLENIRINYAILIRDGISPLLTKYKNRSTIIGKNISVWSDPINSEPILMNRGRVKSIGDYLELYLEGLDTPISSGRVIIE